MKISKEILSRYEDKEIISYNVKFDNGFEVEVLNLGGIITKIITPDINGKLENIVLGYKDIESYIENPSYFGAIIGRTSGRICDGLVNIDGNKYDLAKNYNPHQGHGGNVGFSKKIWDVEIDEKENSATIKLKNISDDMEENYPGKVEAIVSFEIYENYIIEQTYEAIADKTTLINLTNHSYFNLSGNIKSPITEQYLTLASDYILEIDETCATTGKKINVEQTPFDFRKTECIGDRIDDNHKQIQIGCGYDHSFLLNNTEEQISLVDNVSRRSMTISTNQKCAVIYSMNFPDNVPLYNGKDTQRRYGICFETQAPPIGRGLCFIEDSIINKDDKYLQKTTYKFSIK
ncbi:MAG: aldose epimerase family protein [Peptostreptococcaceae bacterium]